MQARHLPTIDARYWAVITLASIFGTNMGDFCAHESGLGLLGCLPILVALFAAAFVAERFDKRAHQAYYWLCIIIMRTGATNIADYLGGRRGLHIDRVVLSFVFVLTLAALACWAAYEAQEKGEPSTPEILPDTNPRYWTTMLTAGVLGIVLGDLIEHLIPEGLAALALSIALGAALLIYRQRWLPTAIGYWLVVGVGCAAGTAIGDWLADIKAIGLPLCTLLTGLAFTAVLVLWRTGRGNAATLTV